MAEIYWNMELASAFNMDAENEVESTVSLGNPVMDSNSGALLVARTHEVHSDSLPNREGGTALEEMTTLEPFRPVGPEVFARMLCQSLGFEPN